MSNTVQLKTESVLRILFGKHDKDFTFLVNSQNRFRPLQFLLIFYHQPFQHDICIILQ